MNATTGIVGWTSEPPGRGTLGLLWSCFATIFLCTWSAIHPSVPGCGESNTRLAWHRLKHVFCFLLLPEWYALDAITNFADVRALQAKTPGWSLKKTFFAAMDGLTVEYEMNGQIYRPRLRSEVLFDLLLQESLTWPDFEDADIDDRSKADGLVKLFALSQILWFVAQVIGRLAQHLAITTLELFTLGIVRWAVAIYGLLWEKLFDVRRPLVVRVHANEQFTIRGDDLKPAVRGIYFIGVQTSHKIVVLSRTQGNLCTLVCAIASLGFSALHLAAWKFYFSSAVEMWLWRATSVACAIVPLLIAVGFWLDADTAWWWNPVSVSLTSISNIGRAYMFVEMLVGLRAAPASVYQTPQWSQYFPSVG